APEPAVISGRVFIDLDADGVFDGATEEAQGDEGLQGVSVGIETPDETFMVTSGSDGVWTAQIDPGPAVVTLSDRAAVPEGFVPSGDNLGQLVECVAGEECMVEPMGFMVALAPPEDVKEFTAAEHPLPDPTIEYLVATAQDDVTRAALGEVSHLQNIRVAALDRLFSEFGRRITEDDLQEVKTGLVNSPPPVLQDDGPDPEGGSAAGEVVAAYLQANYLINQSRLEELRAEAAGEVPDVTVDYTEDQVIVTAGTPMTQLHIDAIEATAVPTLEEQPEAGLMAVLVVLVSLVGVYLATFRPEFWSRPRMVSLLGIMVVLAAASVRAAVAAQRALEGAPGSPGWYVLPAVAFGFVTAVLFDQRIAVLMALAVGVLTAAGTLDTGATVYAILAALAPIPFVSAVSTRGSFRNAVVFSSLVAACVAAATSWFFHVGPTDPDLQVIGLSVAWAFGVSVLASLVGLAVLQFFESAFDITTTLGLLDLTDRNHKALQMLQDKAFGTFNHSLMVGTLADAAARSIGANALLARAMAYYHDLGKTENPTFFIENQFGIPNPHDQLDPRESAEILRSHVTSGVALARQYNIPTEVTEGIVSHHGDGVMRYFYEKARQQEGVDVDIDDFRHIGHKPRTAETAILMLADSLEAACRANFQSAEPTPDAIEKVVDRVMDEKLEDGQLSESPLTLGQISRIRQAFLESLVGHYHQRIAYPNFPGN
ncbi:MAG TPA: HDIG domain-containing protein, partial [Acidimicrobiia bacterium]